MRSQQLGITVQMLLGVESNVVYEGLRDAVGDEALADLDRSGFRNEFVVRMWTRSEPEDWPFWSEPLDPKAAKVPPEAVDPLLSVFFRRFNDLPEEAQTELPKQVGRVVRLRQNEPRPDDSYPALTELESALRAAPWARDTSPSSPQERLHSAAHELRPLDKVVDQRVEEMLTSSLVDALREMDGVPGSQRAQEVMEGVEVVAAPLSGRSLVQIASAIPSFDPETAAESAAAEISTRATLALLAESKDIDISGNPGFVVSSSRVVAVAEAERQERALAAYLALGPSVDDVFKVLTAPKLGPKVSEPVAEGLNRWAKRVKKTQRTALVGRLIDHRWSRIPALRVLGQSDLNETKVSERLKARILDGPNDHQRKQTARDAQALSLKAGTAGQILSDTACGLLKKGRPKSDISVAVMVVEAIPKGHVKTGLLSAAFKEACKRHGDYHLPAADAIILRNAGVKVTEKMVKPKKRKKVFGFI